MLTQARLKELVRYDPETGRFTVVGKMRGKRRGALAGHINPDGYRRITIDGRQYGGNQLAWLYMTGALPPAGNFIDHRDGKPGNDRWKNLRLADRFQNMANRKVNRGKKGGLKGAYPMAGGRWMAIITSRRTRHYLGCFGSAEDAHAAYRAKAVELNGEFARHG